jgi:hypothetical protein
LARNPPDCQHSPSTGYIVILPGIFFPHRGGIYLTITILEKKTIHKFYKNGENHNLKVIQQVRDLKKGTAGNYQLIDVESTVRMGFPPGITTSGTRNPPEEYDYAGNNQLMEADSDQSVRKILKAVTISGSASTNPIYCEGQLFKKLKYKKVIKMKNKPEAHIYSMK